MSARSRVMSAGEYACNFNQGFRASLGRIAGIAMGMVRLQRPLLTCPRLLHLPSQVLHTGLRLGMVARAKGALRRARLLRPCLRDSAAGPPRSSRGP